MSKDSTDYKKKDPTDHGLYMCQDCGNTTPIPDEVCSSCGGKMMPLDGEEEHLNDELHGESDGNDESLDDLRDREEKESEDEYHNSFQDTDNIE